MEGEGVGVVLPAGTNPPPEVEEVVTVTSAPVNLTLRQRVRRLKVVFLLIFLLGSGSAVAAPNIPNLIVSSFGGNSYLISGLFAGGKGLLACIYAPAIGSLSDGRNRRIALVVTQAVAMISTIVYLASENYLAFAAVDTVLGVSGPILSLLMTCVTDYIPAACPARTETFAMTMFFFLLGVAIGPLASMAVSVYMSFVIGLVLSGIGVIIAFLLLPPAERYREEDEQIAREYVESAVRGRCPVLPTGRLTALINSERGEDAPLLDARASEPRVAADVADSAIVSVETGCPAQQEDDDVAATDPAAASVTNASSSTTVEPPTGCCGTVSAAASRMRKVFGQNRSLRLVLLIVFWSCMCQEALESSLMLYLKRKAHFTSNDFIPLIAIVSLSGLISLGIVVASLKRCVGTLRTLQICIGGNVLFALGLCFVYEKWQAYAVSAFGILGYGVFPCSSSLVAHAVPQHSAGAAQGILTSMRMLAQAIGPVVFGAIFHATQYTELPGASYLIGAGCGLVALVTAAIVARMVQLP